MYLPQVEVKYPPPSHQGRLCIWGRRVRILGGRVQAKRSDSYIGWISWNIVYSKIISSKIYIYRICVSLRWGVTGEGAEQPREGVGRNSPLPHQGIFVFGDLK